MKGSRYEPHPRLEGWMTWMPDKPGFAHLLGEIVVRPEGEGWARVRWFPVEDVVNVLHGIHGGALLGFADIALFAGARAGGVPDSAGGTTIECSCQFLGPAKLGAPVDALVEVLQETRRLAFLRGTMEQEDRRIAAFSGVIRKISAK